MRRICVLVALGGTAAIARADVSFIDIKLRPWGSTGAWSDSLNLVSTGTVPIDLEGGVFYHRSAGYGLATVVHNIVGSPYSGANGDLATVLDRPDSNVHPDGRLGTFNFTTSSDLWQVVYHTGTSGVDANRFRISSSMNAVDTAAGGIHLNQDSAPNLGTNFDASDPVFGYHFKLSLACYNNGAPRTVTIDAPLNKISVYRAYSTSTSTTGTNIPFGTSDPATVTVSWVPAPAILTPLGLCGLCVGRRRTSR